MKKIITISALALLLVFVSCSDKKETPTEKAEKTETTETTTQETTAQEQTEESNKTVIKLNLKKGDTYSITMKKDEKISMELEGENKWGKQLS